MVWNDFDPTERVQTIAADTEAFTLVDGERLPTETILAYGADGEHPASWWREHTTVHVYAWLVSDGRKTACFDNFDAFTEFCTVHRVDTVWWYNAKYDFAHIDYALLTGGWTLRADGKLKHREYRSLHGSQGQRYSLSLALEYRAENRHKHVHTCKHYDLCNIFGGGLAKCLKSFNVTDFDGKPIRKLEADYQEGASREYMEGDVIGLYHLVRTCDTFLQGKWGYTLMGKKPDVMTAGGLAKRVLLSYCNGFCKNHQENVKEFQRWHRVDINADSFYRAHGLYRGGITMVNRAYQNIPITRPVFKYDINSMYPHQMHRMPDLVGTPVAMTFEEWQEFDNKGAVHAAYIIDHARGAMRAGMLPMFYDRCKREYTPVLCIEETDTPLMIFVEEWEELQRWYDATFHVEQVYVWVKAPAHGFRKFVEDNYEMKRKGKKDGDKVMESFAKLLLNSSYGKLAENPRKDISHRELSEETGAVVLVDDGLNIDENSLLSVVQGALITSMARVQLMTLIRETCPIPARDFVYCDTDSIISFTQYPRPDPYTLGALKDETVIDGISHPYTFSKFLAPKTYLLHRVIDGVPDVEIHTKGIPSTAVKTDPQGDERTNAGKISPTTPTYEIDRIFSAGQRFTALSGMNVRGGKALVPVLKELCKVENTIVHGSHEQNTIEIMEDA